MHLYIAGICGSFMAGLARLALAQGERVRGCDRVMYPPMSSQLDELGISVDSGFSADHLSEDCKELIVGNALSRGNPLLEEALLRGIPYTSGPAWLARQVLSGRLTLAVAGTHGKTTAASMLSWILRQAADGRPPGFLIGGVPCGFKVSSSLGEGPWFVVEADEYDTAFFDKRPKFMHYRPRVLMLNNLEFDHADIYDDLEMIKRQFHYLIRTVPSHGIILYNKGDASLLDVIARGVWTPTETFAVNDRTADWSAQENSDGFELFYRDRPQGVCEWNMSGLHNISNALSAIGAARYAGVSTGQALDALASFSGVKRRLERIARVNEVTIYDDFAHHPTEIAATLAAARKQAAQGRLLAVFEPRSNTMRLGRHNHHLPQAFAVADRLFFYQPDNLSWAAENLFSSHPEYTPDRFKVFYEHQALLRRLQDEAQAGDHVIFMSTGDFSGLPHKFAERLQCLNA